MGHVALEVPLRALATVGRRQRHDATGPRVQVGRDSKLTVKAKPAMLTIARGGSSWAGEEGNKGGPDGRQVIATAASGAR